MQGHGKLWNLDNFAAVKPRNFANSPAKFGKNYCRKLWALIINTQHDHFQINFLSASTRCLRERIIIGNAVKNMQKK